MDDMKDNMYDGIGGEVTDFGLNAVIEYTKSPYDNWVMDKTIKVSKNNKRITKKYRNKTNGSTITVIEENGIIFLKDYREWERESNVKKKSTLKELKNNPITVDFLPIVINLCNEDPDCDNEDNCNFSGRIIYGIDENGGFELFDEEHSLQFYCGPETKGGYLDDRGENIIDDKLSRLFEDMNIQVQIAENLHSVDVTLDVSSKDIWNIVEKRLVRSGAVKSKSY